jgi:hypothetical protein
MYERTPLKSGSTNAFGNTVFRKVRWGVVCDGPSLRMANNRTQQKQQQQQQPCA